MNTLSMIIKDKDRLIGNFVFRQKRNKGMVFERDLETSSG